METVLLTGTISPNKEIGDKLGYKSTSLDPKVRYFSYIDTIVYYILNSKFTHIVFCENSNYPFEDKKLIEDLCYIYNKHFELLQFVGDHKKTLEKGYGYGDGECMDYAVDHSKLLKESKTWHKITGRYKISNINKIIDELKYKDGAFLKGVPFESHKVNTGFFKTSTSVYKTYLYESGTMCDFTTHILETAFYDRLQMFIQTKNKQYSFQIKNYPFFSHIGFKKNLAYVVLNRVGFYSFYNIYFWFFRFIKK